MNMKKFKKVNGHNNRKYYKVWYVAVVDKRGSAEKGEK